MLRLFCGRSRDLSACFFNVFCLFLVVFGLFFAMLAFFDGLRKGRRAKRASKASERSSLVLLALVLKLIFGRLGIPC